MYCGFCVEACPVVSQAPGDAETTAAIRFTKEFEGTTSDLCTLTYRYIKPGDRVVFTSYAGEAFQVGDQELLLMREDDILAVLG